LAVVGDQGKIQPLGQVFQKVGSLGQNLLIEKIAEEGTVGFGLSGSGGLYLPNNTIS
jgi:hypothetical protein